MDFPVVRVKGVSDILGLLLSNQSRIRRVKQDRQWGQRRIGLHSLPKRGVVQWRSSEIQESLQFGQELEEYSVCLCYCGIRCRLTRGREADSLQLGRKLGKEVYSTLVQDLCSSGPKGRVAASESFRDA